MSALSFFLAWLANPRRIGAIAPSSAALANAITEDLTPASAPVIELGPGTGVFTRSIIARGVPERRLALIEYATDFVDKLRRDFPRAHVHRIWTRPTYDMSNCSTASAPARFVSGIPLLLMPARSVIALLEGAFERLRPDGALYQFTYGRDAPIHHTILARLGLTARALAARWPTFLPRPCIASAAGHRGSCRSVGPRFASIQRPRSLPRTQLLCMAKTS
jgi:phosphatidylethanolamine/phosphatidyl-N-methylethanolamine N-methyltransferase